MKKVNLSKKLNTFTIVFLVLTIVATIVSLIPFQWEPKYILASSMQLAGIIGFSFFAIKKFLIDNNYSVLTKLWKFLPVLTMFFLIVIIFITLTTGKNNYDTGAKRLYNLSYKYPMNNLNSPIYKYFFVQMLLLMQMYNLTKYVFYEINDMEKKRPVCGWDNYYMKIFYVATLINFIPLGLLWVQIKKLYAEG